MKTFSDKIIVARKKNVLFSIKTHQVNQCFEFTALRVLYAVHGRCYQKNLTTFKTVFSIKFSFHNIFILFFPFFFRSKQNYLKIRFDKKCYSYEFHRKKKNFSLFNKNDLIKNASHTNFIERKTRFPKCRADLADGIRDNFFPKIENFL